MGREWTTSDQKEFLQQCLPEFLKVQEDKKNLALLDFKQKTLAEWLERWPIKGSQSPDLTVCDIAVKNLEHKCVNKAPRGKAPTLMLDSVKKGRMHNNQELFEQHFTSDAISTLSKAKVKQYESEADEDTKLKIQRMREKEIKTHKAESEVELDEDGDPIVSPLAGEDREKFLCNFMETFHKYQKHDGIVKAWGIQMSKNKAGLWFWDAYPKYTETIVQPFVEFSEGVLEPLPSGDSSSIGVDKTKTNTSDSNGAHDDSATDGIDSAKDVDLMSANKSDPDTCNATDSAKDSDATCSNHSQKFLLSPELQCGATHQSSMVLSSMQAPMGHVTPITTSATTTTDSASFEDIFSSFMLHPDYTKSVPHSHTPLALNLQMFGLMSSADQSSQSVINLSELSIPRPNNSDCTDLRTFSNPCLNQSIMDERAFLQETFDNWGSHLSLDPGQFDVSHSNPDLGIFSGVLFTHTDMSDMPSLEGLPPGATATAESQTNKFDFSLLSSIFNSRGTGGAIGAQYNPTADISTTLPPNYTPNVAYSAISNATHPQSGLNTSAGSSIVQTSAKSQHKRCRGSGETERQPEVEGDKAKRGKKGTATRVAEVKTGKDIAQEQQATSSTAGTSRHSRTIKLTEKAQQMQ
ncbi:hypothetical protein GYMLUDRAFT_245931 [Collybiopsis luxurians FD-317 M1]|uniref:Uncharacterized protein n=1 Tax=Collybiopsis luxurians FD-317 M1 TaxID=944289 RepID=A0A0D0BT46_9AGAR|nr:hypothetical protein GYMLUDRAFT_245931 [Collybiopsis luxurians FD-317 M1]